MAKPKFKTPASDGFQVVSSDLNIWNREWDKAKPGKLVVGLVIGVDPNATIGEDRKQTLRVEIETPDGEQFTLPAHAVLVGRLKRLYSMPGGLVPYTTVLRVKYEGTEKSRFKTPMQMYELAYRQRTADDIGWDHYPLPAKAE